jgi:uncharacterized protein YkwD
MTTILAGTALGPRAEAFNLRDFDNTLPPANTAISTSSSSSSRTPTKRPTRRTSSSSSRSSVRVLTSLEARRAARLARSQQLTATGSARATARLKLLAIRFSNARRAENNAPPLSSLPVLELTAQAHAEDMVARNFFSHVSPDGKTLEDRLTAQHYYDQFYETHCNCRIFAAENIAKGYQDAKEVVQGWMDSPGHRQSLLNPNYTWIGIGLAGDTWVQVFGGTLPIEKSDR